MKLISVAILLTCLIAATFSQWLLIACFDLNENYVAKEFCINKNNPSAHCNGHCYLNRQLNNEEKSDNPLNTSLKEKFDIQLFCVDALNNIQAVTSDLAIRHSQIQNFTRQEFLKTSFHPPCVAITYSIKKIQLL